MLWRAIFLILFVAFCHQGAAVQSQSSASPSAASLFEWQDTTGQYTTRARFIVLTGETVTLEKKDGTRVEIPLSKLRADHAQRARDLESFADGRMEQKYVAEAPIREEKRKKESSENFSNSIKAELGITSTPEEARFRLDEINTPGKTSAWRFAKLFYMPLDTTDEMGGIHKQLRKLSRILSDDFKKDYLFPVILVLNFLFSLVLLIWWLKILLADGCVWGCAYFIPFINIGVILYYLFARWEDVRRPFLLGLVSWLINFAAHIFVPSWAHEVAKLEIWLATLE